jgi:hypothetical protein
MKSKRLISTIGAGLAVVVALGMLAAWPAQAGNTNIKISHSDTPYRDAGTPVSSTSTKAQPTAKQAAPKEVQVAVMAKSPSPPPPAKRSCYIHR